VIRLNPRFFSVRASNWRWAAGWIGLLGLVAAGCGGDATPPTSKKSGPVASTPPTSSPGYGGGSPYGGGGDAEPKARPDDVKTWTDQDLLDAKKENDPRVGPASMAYSKANVGQDPAAEFLVALVTKEPEAEGDAQGGGYNPYRASTSNYVSEGDGSLDGFAGVIAALGVNNTKKSREAIEQILGGKLATPLDDAAAVSAAIKTLSDNKNAENEATLLKILSSPETVRAPAAGGGASTDSSASYGEVTPASLQQEALNLVAPTASAELRTKLAKQLLARMAQGGGIGADSTPEGNPLINFLLEARPDNVEAQAMLYPLPSLPADIRARIEGNFLAFSSSALRELLNMPLPTGEAAQAAAAAAPTAGYGRGRQPGYGASSASAFSATGEPAEETPMTPEQAAVVASSVWRDDMIKALTARLPKGKVERSNATPEDNQPLLLLASMPVDPARTALTTWLERKRDDAAEQLLSAGLYEQSMSDPGLLAVVKPLERAKRKPRTRRGDDAGTGTGPGAAASEAEPLRDLVEVLCRKAREASGGKTSGDFPITFQGESTPTSQLSGDFPGDAKLKGLTPVPVAIHYAFIEQEHKLPIVQGHYSRQLTSLVEKPRIKEIGEDGIWLDAYKRDKKTGKVRTADVFIKKAGDSSSSSSGSSSSSNPDETRSRRAEPENLTIEILIVETQTPPDEKPAAEVSRKP